jgi:hypothetical protein
MPNLGGVMRAFDALVMLRDVARRFTGDAGPAPTALEQTAAPQALRPGGALETTLTNVVVAALKEAFDRDHARLELERQQIEEQRRRAEEALRAEQQRQAVEREIDHCRGLDPRPRRAWRGVLGAAARASGLAGRRDDAAALAPARRAGADRAEPALLIMFKKLMIGAAAGAAATVPMTMTMEKLHELLPGEPPRPLPPREVTESIAEKTGVAQQVDEPGMQALTLGAHVGYGAACGAVLGLITPKKVPAAVAVGALFGLAVWAGSYKGWLPALHIRHDAKHDPPARNGLMIAAHMVWGAAAGLEIASGGEEDA